MLLRLKLAISSILQTFKSGKTLKKTTQFVNRELSYLQSLTPITGEKRGTLIVKCDDIGDFLVWQQVIPSIVEHAEKPIIFVGNSVVQPLYNEYFDFADQQIWIKKQDWDNEEYRHQIYHSIRLLNVKTAFTTLFTRNFKLDDVLVKASNADNRYAWSIGHHSYFKNYSLADQLFTKTIISDTKVKLEYFRNIEFINSIFKANQPETFKALFPNFKKYNTLIVVPVASAGSKTWARERFAATISNVLNDFDKIIMIAGKNGVEAADYIANTVNSNKLINLVNQTKLHESFAFIGEARALLTLDTFTSHVGVLVKTDTVLVSNGTNWQRFADYTKYVDSKFISILPNHVSKNYQTIKTQYSSSEINSISVETVVKALKSLNH